MLVRLADAVDLAPFSDAPATFVTQSEAMRYLSDAANAVAQKHRAFGLIARSTNIPVTAGTKTYPIPADFAALINITTQINGQPLKLDRVDVDDIDLQPLQNGVGWQTGNAGYCILGEELLTTDPGGSYLLTLRYVPEMPMFSTGGVRIGDFTLTSDYVLCKGTLDQWIVLAAAVKVQRKQRIDPTPELQALEALEMNLIQNMADRDEHDARTVRNAWDASSNVDYFDGWR